MGARRANALEPIKLHKTESCSAILCSRCPWKSAGGLRQYSQKPRIPKPFIIASDIHGLESWASFELAAGCWIRHHADMAPYGLQES